MRGRVFEMIARTRRRQTSGITNLLSCLCVDGTTMDRMGVPLVAMTLARTRTASVGARERERAPVLLCVALSGRGAPEVLFTGVRGSVHGTCARTSHRVKTARGRVARAPETECDTFRLYDTHGSAVRSPHAPHLSWAAGGTRLTDTERHERHIYVHTLYMP